jgi:hypothetical protein
MPRFSLPASWRARATECGLARMLRQDSLSWSTPPMRKPAARHMFFDPGRRAELRGDRTTTRSVDQSCLPNRSYPPEGPCFKFRDSGEPGVALPTTVPGATLGDSHRVRGTHGIGRRKRERFGSHHSSEVNSVCADLGACRPFFPCSPDDAQREYHASATAAGSKCIPVGSAASTVTEPVLPRRMAANLRQRAAPPSSTSPDSKLC